MAYLEVANASTIAICGDNSFGPTTISSPTCRDGFDFTLLFEQTIFTILPAAILLCVSPLRLRSIWRRPTTVKSAALGLTKMSIVAVLASLKLALLIFYALPAYGLPFHTKATIAAATLDLLAVIDIAILSPLEHARSIRPSALIGTFLLFTTLLDAARVRSDWLIAGPSPITALSLASVLVKLCLLVLEALRKVASSTVRRSPERTSNIYSLSLFTWLNPLIWTGYHGNLSLDGLFALPGRILSRRVGTRLDHRWTSGEHKGDNDLAWAIVKAFWPAITATMIPRTCLDRLQHCSAIPRRSGH